QRQEGQEEVAEDEHEADVPPRTVFALHVPKCFFRDGVVPDQEILGEGDIGVKNGKRKEQHAGVVKSLFVHDSAERTGSLQQQRYQVERAESYPNASCKIINAVHGGKPLVLEGFYP